MELIFLGTGNAFSESGDRPSSYAIQYEEEIILLDCGPSILPALYQNAISPVQISTIIISHIHPDHYLGLTLLFLDNFYISRRGNPIDVIGPFGLKDKIHKLLLEMFSHEEVNSLFQAFNFVETDVTDVVNLESAKLSFLAAKHFAGGKMSVLEFENGITIGYSGDTGFQESSFNELVETSDIIIHEATSAKYHIEGHTNLFDIIDMTIPESKHLFLTHHDHTVIEALEHVQLPSNLHLARDNDTVNVKKLLNKSKLNVDS